MEFCRTCDARAGTRQIAGCLSDLDSFQGQLGKSMTGEGREKHLLNKTNPELQRVYKVVLSSL